jgi:hypothetical protein
MKNSIWFSGLLCLVCFSNPQAALLTFNSTSTTDVDITRDAWLSAIGINAPSYIIDFESGFQSGENISGIAQIGGLLISDTSSAGEAIVSGGPFGGSSPIGQLALEQNEQPNLKFDFSASPVDYFGFRDIDQAGTSGVVTFADSSTEAISFETTGSAGNSAEFFGIFRNDLPRIISVELNASGDGSWAVDNLEYGSPVPIPGAIYLLLSGIAGLLVKNRRG